MRNTDNFLALSNKGMGIGLPTVWAVVLGLSLVASSCTTEKAPEKQESPSIAVKLNQASLIGDLRKISFPGDAPIKIEPQSKEGNSRGNLQVAVDFTVLCRNGQTKDMPRLNLGLYKALGRQTWQIRYDVILHIIKETDEACQN